MELRFLYVGVDDTARALAQWTDTGWGSLRWRFRHFGADVAGVEVGSGPLVLLADHRPTGSVLPIWAVDDLDAERRRLSAGGWAIAGPLGTPEGDALVATSTDGVELALLQVTRPDALDHAFDDPDNPHRELDGRTVDEA